jgi:hypothetical protein
VSKSITIKSLLHLPLFKAIDASQILFTFNIYHCPYIIKISPEDSLILNSFNPEKKPRHFSDFYFVGGKWKSIFHFVFNSLNAYESSYRITQIRDSSKDTKLLDIEYKEDIEDLFFFLRNEIKIDNSNILNVPIFHRIP